MRALVATFALATAADDMDTRLDVVNAGEEECEFSPEEECGDSSSSCCCCCCCWVEVRELGSKLGERETGGDSEDDGGTIKEARLSVDMVEPPWTDGEGATRDGVGAEETEPVAM